MCAALETFLILRIMIVKAKTVSLRASKLSYSFDCSGTVTGWGAFVQGGANDAERIDFQVWRCVANEEYELVGFNLFLKEERG